MTDAEILDGIRDVARAHLETDEQIEMDTPLDRKSTRLNSSH